jgi:hypothetical protein
VTRTAFANVLGKRWQGKSIRMDAATTLMELGKDGIMNRQALHPRRLPL